MTYACSLPAFERFDDGGRVDDRVAREIQDHAPRGIASRRAPIDELVRRLVERHVYGNDVRACEQIVEVHGLLHARRQLPRVLHRDRRVVTEHVHAELQCRIRDLDADCAEADDAERALRQLEADELFLASLDGLVELIARALQRVHVVSALAAGCAPP